MTGLAQAAHLGYRPDIDGIRSIAVLSVVLHHLFPSLLPGGFIGVDIFFVISGFLITSQIYREIVSETFSLKAFYIRRINRIIPALVVVTTATLCLGFAVLSPANFGLLAASAVTSIFGMSNFFFWREYGNYFTSNSAEAPLLHTWSLGVEEQFYLIWPLLLLLLVRNFRRFHLLVLAAMVLVAFAISEGGTRFAISASYFLLPTRFFELLVGCALATWTLHHKPVNEKASAPLFISGMALIFGSLIFLNKQSAFPGVNAVWPCLGTALLIWSGHVKSKLHKILTNKAMVFVGLISYSLYLWHWPLIAYLNYLDIRIEFFLGGLVLLTSVVLASLSWRFVELPVRRRGINMPPSKAFIQHLIFPASLFLALHFLASYTSGFPMRFDPQVSHMEAALNTKPNILRAGCHSPTAKYLTPPDESCRIGIDKQKIDGLLIGDSFANHFTGMLAVLAKDSDLTLMDYTMDGCPPVLGFRTRRGSSYAERCLARNEMAYAKIASGKFAHIVLAANWPNDDDLTDALSSSIDAILSTGAKPTLILANSPIRKAHSCPIRTLMFEKSRNCDSPLRTHPAYLDAIRAKYPQINVLDPNTVICPEGRCNPVLDETLLYRDEVHLNHRGSQVVGLRLVKLGVSLHHN